MDFVCEKCGEICDESTERMLFEKSFPVFSYDNLQLELCSKCAEECINDYETEVYRDTCIECGDDFDYGEEADSFESENEESLYWIYLHHGVLCCKCAERYID